LADGPILHLVWQWPGRCHLAGQRPGQDARGLRATRLAGRALCRLPAIRPASPVTSARSRSSREDVTIRAIGEPVTGGGCPATAWQTGVCLCHPAA